MKKNDQLSEKEISVSYDFANAINNVQISEQTKSLLLCRAKLSEIYNNISTVISDEYDEDVDAMFPGFWDVFSKFDDEIMKIISCSISTVSLNSNYEQI